MLGRSAAPETVNLVPVNPDPVVSLRPWGARVAFGDRMFTVPAVDAAGWLELLLCEPVNFEALFPGLAGPQAVTDVNQMIVAGEASDADLEQAILDLVEAVSGRSWWVTLRLCFSVRRNWDAVGGELARLGVHAQGVPLGFWLDAAYATMIDLIMKGPKPKQAADFSRALTQPPPQAAREFDEVANAHAFLAALRSAQ